MKVALSKLKKFSQEHSVGIYLIAFMVPFQPKWYGLAIMILILEQIIKRPKIKSARIFENLSLKYAGVWLLMFFVMHLVGLFSTQNFDFAWMDIGMKASFIIFPLFFILTPIQINWKNFMNAFLIGVFVSVLFNLTSAIINYTQINDFNYFYGPDLSQLMHRSYWATYLSMAYFFFWYKFLFENTNRLIALLGVGLTFTLTLLTGAKIGIILLLLITIVMIVVWIKISKKRIFIVLTIFGLFLSIFFVNLKSPQILERVQLSYKTVLIPMEKRDKTSFESTTARILMWDTAYDLISENFWFGVGTGDVKDELQKRNYEKGFTGVADKNFNSHNQFLNSHVAIGFFGVLFLLLSFLTPILFTKGNYKYMIIGVVVILFLSLIPEAFLETQAGIVPVAFFLSLFGIRAQEKTSRHE